MTDLTKYDPEQVMEKMVHMRAESGVTMAARYVSMTEKYL